VDRPCSRPRSRGRLRRVPAAIPARRQHSAGQASGPVRNGNEDAICAWSAECRRAPDAHCERGGMRREDALLLRHSSGTVPAARYHLNSAGLCRPGFRSSGRQSATLKTAGRRESLERDGQMAKGILRALYASARAQSQRKAQHKSDAKRQDVRKRHAHDATTGCSGPVRASRE
jgi:hypothetical protein